MKWKKKGKEEYLYSAFLHQGTHKVLRHGSHSFTCKQHHACLCIVNVHQMSPPQQLRQRTSNCSLLLIYWPRKDERLSWPGWLIYSGWFTDISGHPSATGQAQDSESTPAKGQRSTAGPRNLMSELFCHMLASKLSCRMRDVPWCCSGCVKSGPVFRLRWLESTA